MSNPNSKQALKGSQAKWQVSFTCYVPPSTVGKSNFFKVWAPRANSVGKSVDRIPMDDGTEWAVMLNQETASLPVYDDARPVQFVSPWLTGETGVINLGAFVGFLVEEVGLTYNHRNRFTVTVKQPDMDDQVFSVKPWLPVFDTLNQPGYPEYLPGAGVRFDLDGNLSAVFKMTGDPMHMTLAVFVTVATVTAAVNGTLPTPDPKVDVLKEFAYRVMTPANLVTGVGRGTEGAHWHGSRDWHKALVDCRKSAGVAQKAA